MTALEVTGVTVEFSGLKALNSVSLTLHRGEILGLIGPNGSGKTTLINAITGQVPLATGHVQLGQIRLSNLDPRRIALAGVSRSFQVVRLFSNMTVLENVETAALAKGFPRRVAREKARAMLSEFSLSARADDLAAELNYGDKRRVEIARALTADPAFLLLDEPAAGMNEAESDALMQILSRLPEEKGVGLLIIDHDMGLILRLCGRLHVIAMGSTIAEGAPNVVRRNPAVIEAYLGSEADNV